MRLKIAGIIPESVVDAPGGISYTIFSQGCHHNCLGCHNPSTHSLQGGQEIDCSFILDDLKNYPLSKIVTFSGGEPFIQTEAFIYLAKELKNKGYKIVAYTGYMYEELLKDNLGRGLLSYIDVLIDGPFKVELKDISLNFKGSSNQRIIDVQKSFKEGRVSLLKL